MPKRVIADINLSVVAANLSEEEGRAVDEAEVRQWLHDAGFRPHGERWIVDEPDLGQLAPSEVRSIEFVDGDGGASDRDTRGDTADKPTRGE
jgi:hypothetical protein